MSKSTETAKKLKNKYKNEKVLDLFKRKRSDRFTLILNDNELNLLKNSRYILNKIQDSELPYLFIAIIKHDRDKREDDKNSLKTEHYHMVLQVNGQFAVGTILNYICDIFHLNENQVTIDKCNSIEMQTRYLLHLDDPDKEQYFIWDIETNDKTILDRYLKLKIIKDLNSLITFVREEHYNLENIMSKIANYDKYRKYINDLIVNYYRKK